MLPDVNVVMVNFPRQEGIPDGWTTASQAKKTGRKAAPDPHRSGAQISDFERGRRVPALPVILEYARVAGVYMDVLVDDELDLPNRLPSSPKHGGISRRLSAKKSSR
jgi:transcriptional regulator with XRE-family HTH domain